MNKKTHKDPVLKDTLNEETRNKLQRFKQEAANAEEQKRKEEAARKEEERKLREKNKSFEELLNESSLDWKKYKN